ncbi:MAG: class I SAM-dependent methyltransferase [Armatimonadota bacterium]
MNTTVPIVNQIEQAVQPIPGWSPIDQLLTLFTLAYSSSDIPGDILELGSWCGRSAVALGMAARLSGKGKVHCIDLFPDKDDWYQNADGSYSFAVTIDGERYGAYQDQTVWEEPFLRDIKPMYERFQGTLDAFNIAIRNNGLDEYVVPYRNTLEGFARSVPSNFALRLAFIDGDHSFSAVSKDIEIVERFLLPNGWICFDDAFSSYEGVNEAIQRHVIDSGRYRNFQQMTRKCFVAQRRA